MQQKRKERWQTQKGRSQACPLSNQNGAIPGSPFFVGKSDDITYYQFKDLIENIYGKNTTLQDVINNKDKN